MLTITLSELISDVQVTQPKMDGSFEESGECQRLCRSLQQIAQESISADLLRECGLLEDSLTAVLEGVNDHQWGWAGVVELFVVESCGSYYWTCPFGTFSLTFTYVGVM